MDANLAREVAALHETPCIIAASSITLRSVQRIRRAAKYAVSLPPGQWAIGNLDPVLQFLTRIQLVRVSAARLGQEHADNLEDVLQELQALLAEGPEHSQLLQTRLDAALMPVLQASHKRIASCTKRAAELITEAASARRWAVVKAGSTAFFAASTCSALATVEEPPHFTDKAPPSAAAVGCVAGAAMGLWVLSSPATSRIVAVNRAKAARLEGEAALGAVAQASLVEDWMKLEGALLVGFADTVQGALLALQGELLGGRVGNVHEHCLQLGRSVIALQHALALLTCPM